MKPCSRNRKLIACLVLDELDARKAAALREHFALCEGCRRYWQEISNVAEGLASAAPDSSLEASEFFHHRVAEKLQAADSSSMLENLTAWLRGAKPNWRAALPAIAVLAIAYFATVAPRNHSNLPPPAPLATQIESASGSESDLAPTLANYQKIANQSLEKLSDLLTKQGNKSLPPAPVYTASSFQLAEGSF